MTDQTIELSIPSHPRFLQLVRGVMKNLVQFLSIPLDQADYIILAVDEACSNIIRHSYLDDPTGKIDFSIHYGKDSLDISIIDYGKQCDLNLLTPRDPDTITPGGLGLYIIHQVMDKVKFQCSDNDRNILRMVKKLNGADQSLSPKRDRSLKK